MLRSVSDTSAWPKNILHIRILHLFKNNTQKLLFWQWSEKWCKDVARAGKRVRKRFLCYADVFPPSKPSTHMFIITFDFFKVPKNREIRTFFSMSFRSNLMSLNRPIFLKHVFRFSELISEKKYSFYVINIENILLSGPVLYLI